MFLPRRLLSVEQHVGAVALSEMSLDVLSRDASNVFIVETKPVVLVLFAAWRLVSLRRFIIHVSDFTIIDVHLFG